MTSDQKTFDPVQRSYVCSQVAYQTLISRVSGIRVEITGCSFKRGTGQDALSMKGLPIVRVLHGAGEVHMQGSTQRRARVVKVNTNRLVWIKRTGEDDGEKFSFSFVPVTPIA